LVPKEKHCKEKKKGSRQVGGVSSRNGQNAQSAGTGEKRQNKHVKKGQENKG